jgi:hypothetical protein
MGIKQFFTKQAAFTMSVNKPSVKIVIGSARMCSTGRIKAFTRPITIAAISATQKLATAIPGTKYATSMTPSADKRRRTISLNIGKL